MYNLMGIPMLRDTFRAYLRREYISLGNDYSVTELIDCPRVVQLRKRHKKELFEMDVTDEEVRSNIKSFIGTAIHDAVAKNLFEFVRHNPRSGWLIERKIWDKIADRKIVGKFDAYINGLLQDLKTTSVWKFVFKQYQDYENQLNVYAHLLRGDNITVTMLQIIMWFTDYDVSRAYQNADYPKDIIEPVTISNLWSPKVAKGVITSMVERHISNENLSDDKLDQCTPADFWAKEDQFAIVAPGAKRAVRLLSSEADAQDYIANSKNKDRHTWNIDKRAGVRTRCDKFCKVNVFCNQYKQYMSEKGEVNGILSEVEYS